MKKFPKLFHKTSKGAMNTWEVWADGPCVYTRWGQLNGKMQESCVECTPKNIGKKNGTTASEQAELEAQSLWTHKRERKYYESQKDAEGTVIFLPMLAQSFDKRKRFLDLEEDFPCEIQPKLDGTRSLSYWDQSTNKVKLMSRGGKEYLLPHLVEELEPKLPENYVLDGELYVHGLPLQDLNALVRRTKNMNPESIKVEYHVYDLVDKKKPNLTWRERYELLQNFFNKTKFKKIIPVQTDVVYNEEEVYEIQSEYLHLGFEGAVVRLPDGKYKWGYRSKELLKVKSFQDEEFEIIGYKNGVGKFETCIIYTCKTKEGKEFDVVPKGTFEQREQWLKEGDSHVGEMLKVQFAEWTNNGIPQFPVGICIRLPEDM